MQKFDAASKLGRVIGGVVLAAGLILAPVGAAFADMGAKYKQQIETFKAQVITLSEADEAKLATDELTLLTRWLEESEKLLAVGDVDGAGYMLKRVEFGVDLATALVAASKIEARTQEQNASSEQMSKQIKELEAEVTKLQEKKAELQSQLDQLR